MIEELKPLCCPALIGLAVFVLGSLAAWLLVRGGTLRGQALEEPEE